MPRSTPGFALVVAALAGCSPALDHPPPPPPPPPPPDAPNIAVATDLPQPYPLPKQTGSAVAFDPLTGVAGLALGYGHTCARLTDGTARCWGENSQGQLGDGTTEARKVPVAVRGLTGVTQIHAGFKYSCAVVTGGALKCWGQGYTRPGGEPVQARSIRDAVQISGSHDRLFAVGANGSVRCWNRFGCDPDHLDPQSALAEQTMPGLAGVTAVSAHWDHQCALLGDGTVKCWGSEIDSATEQQGTSRWVKYPTTIPGLRDVAQIAAGVSFACARLRDGTVKCWGSNWSGRVGAGVKTPLLKDPVPVLGLRGARSIAAGSNHTCAVAERGVMCWGSNDQHQIDAGGQTRLAPVLVLGVSEPVDVAAGPDHTCALVRDGTAVCWGDNSFGQLGTGDTRGVAIPATVHAR